MTLKTVIFDVGGVLLRTVDLEPRARWERELGLLPGELSRTVFDSETGLAAQLGRIDDNQLWLWVGSIFGLSATRLRELKSSFFSGDRVDRELVAYMDRLRRSYSVGLLSNASSVLRSLLAQPLGLAPHVDHVTISAEEGLMKPDARIFRISLARAGASPAEALFIDDFAANVAAARDLGMQVVHFRDPQAAIEAIVDLTGVAHS